MRLLSWCALVSGVAYAVGVVMYLTGWGIPATDLRFGLFSLLVFFAAVALPAAVLSGLAMAICEFVLSEIERLKGKRGS